MSAGLTKNGELRVSISGHSTPTPWFVTAHENSSTPASPVAGDRILFPKNDGWYDLDYAGNVRALVLGTGVAGRITEWNSPTELGSSTLIKSGAGVLTLSAAGDYTLTVPATGTAALLAADNAFSGSNTLSGTVNTIAPGGLRLGTPISQTPTQGGIIARGAGSLVNHGFFSAYWNFYFAANAYHDGTGWKALATNDGTNGYSALFRSDIGGLGAALIVEADSTLRTTGDTRTYTTILSLEFDGQLQLPVSGSSAGLLLGGDALLYRSAANILRTPDSLTVDVGLNVGSATGATTGMIIASGDGRFQNALEVGINGSAAYIQGYNRSTPGYRNIEVWASTSLTALFDTSRNTTLYGGLNVGTATGATTGQIKTSDYINIGDNTAGPKSLLLTPSSVTASSAINFRHGGADKWIIGANVYSGDSAATLQIGTGADIKASIGVNYATLYGGLVVGAPAITPSSAGHVYFGDATYKLYIAPRTAAAGTGLIAGYDVTTYSANVLNLAGGLASGSTAGGVNIAYYNSNWYAALEIRNSSGMGNLRLMQDGGTVTIGNPNTAVGGMSVKRFDVVSGSATTIFSHTSLNGEWAGIIEIVALANNDVNRHAYLLSRYAYNNTFTDLINSSQNSGITLSTSGDNLQMTIGSTGGITYRVVVRIMGSDES